MTKNLLITLVFMTAGSLLNAQENKSNDLTDFKIIIEKTNNGIILKGVEGSVWTDLSFNLNNDRPQAIDELGMTDLNNISSTKNSNLTDFLFTITKTENVIILKGFEGTAWKELSFSLVENGRQAINQFGMTK